MRRYGRVSFFLFFLGMIFVFNAEAAKIVAVEGDVLVKAEGSDLWRVAAVDMVVSPQTEIQTKAAGQCTIAFDDGASRLATIKENSLVKVDSLSPDELYLSGGRVFSLIRSDATGRDFRVKTPTAISGARGTAWTAAFDEGKTSILCVENVVFVAGVDAAGQMTQETDLEPGFGVSVDEAGAVGEVFALAQDQLAEGQQNKQALESLREAADAALPAVPATPASQDTTAASPAPSVSGSGDLAGSSKDTAGDMTRDMPATPEDAPADLSGDTEDMSGPMDNTAKTDDSFDMTRPLGDDMPPVDVVTSSGGTGGSDLQDLTQEIKDETREPPSTTDGGGTVEPPPPGNSMTSG
jgi:hypothetical protein